jgi:hypothetical protein
MTGPRSGGSGKSERPGQPAGGTPTAGPVGSRGFEMDAPLFVISVAAALSGMRGEAVGW